jgi:hypothetical protein
MTDQLPGVTKPMRAVLRIGSLAFLLAVPLATLIGFVIDGSSGGWGAFLGMAIPFAFFTGTVIVALLTVRVSVSAFGAVVLGSWILKLILLLAVLFFLRDADFFNRPIFFVSFLIGTAGYLVLEALVVIKTRVPYIEVPKV